jgi:hypothetical protein
MTLRDLNDDIHAVLTDLTPSHRELPASVIAEAVAAHPAASDMDDETRATIVTMIQSGLVPPCP